MHLCVQVPVLNVLQVLLVHSSDVIIQNVSKNEEVAEKICNLMTKAAKESCALHEDINSINYIYRYYVSNHKNKVNSLVFST